MTRKTTRKRHHQRPVFVYTYSLLDLMFASTTEPMPQAFRTHQLSRMHQGLAAIERAEQPTPEDWRLCSDAVNLMETLVREMQVAEDTRGLLDDAVFAMAMAGRRYFTHGCIRLDGAGIQAIRALLEDYAALLDVLPERTVKDAHRRTEKRIHEILANKRQPHDVEVMAL